MSDYHRPIIVWEACSLLSDDEALSLMINQAKKTPNITYWRVFGGTSFGCTMKGTENNWRWEYLIHHADLPFSMKANQNFFAKEIVKKATPQDLEEYNDL